jgi:hypothetical protein
MAKYAELIDDFELEKRIRTIPEDMELTEYIKQRGGVDYPEEEKADGGTVGIEILFEKKKDGGRIGFQGGGMDASKSDFKSPGSKSYSRSYNPGAGGVVQHSSVGGGGDGPKGPPSITNPYVDDIIEEVVLKKLEDKIPKPDNDPFKNLQGYSKTLPGQNNRFFSMFRTDATPIANKNLLDAALTQLNLSYPDLNFTDEYGFYNTENIKTAVDNAVLEGDISPIEGLNITQSITTQGDPSAIGLSYNNNLLNFTTPDISEGDYKGGIGLNLADYADIPSTYISGNFDVTDDKLFKRDLGVDIGDGTLKLDQTTYPGFDYQKNVVDLNKDLNLANNLNLNLQGNIENLRSDGSTFRTDKSLTPTLTYTGGIGDGGTFKLSGSKEIVEGGSLPNVSFTGSFPIDQKTYTDADGLQTIDKGVISLKGSDLLSGDRSAVLGYDKTIGEIGDNFYLDVGGQIDLTNPENYAGMLKLKKTFKDGGRVGLFMGGDPLTGQALAIYNSMKAYGETDQAIADKLQSLGYYDPNASTTPPPGVPRTQVNQGPENDQDTTYVDRQDYSFNKKNYAPGKQLEVNPAAFGISFEKASKPQGIINAALEMPGRTLTSFASPTTGGNITGPAEEGFMSQVVAIDPAGRTREQLRQQYESYNRFLGAPSNYAAARTPGKAGQVLGTIAGAAAGIPFVGPAIDILSKMGGGDKSLQSKYTVDNVGFGNTGARDEFGLATFDRKDGFLGLTGNTTKDYTDRMQERLDQLDKFFSDRGIDINDPNAYDAMKDINGFYAKQVLAYQQRLAVENINKNTQDAIKAQEEAKKKEEAAFQAQLNETQRQQRMSDLQRIERAYREEVGGRAGSYATGESGIQRDSAGREVGYNDPFDPGGGEKDGGFIDGYNRRKYSNGGLVTMFTRRR